MMNSCNSSILFKNCSDENIHLPHIHNEKTNKQKTFNFQASLRSKTVFDLGKWVTFIKPKMSMQRLIKISNMQAFRELS